jgi:hypothetical protein
MPGADSITSSWQNALFASVLEWLSASKLEACHGVLDEIAMV